MQLVRQYWMPWRALTLGAARAVLELDKLVFVITYEINNWRRLGDRG